VIRGVSKTLHRYVWLYNQHLPQKALNHQTPQTVLKRWQESHPHLFKKKVANHPGPETHKTIDWLQYGQRTPKPVYSTT
jgi:hypothetical protein